MRIGLLWPQTSAAWTAGNLYFGNLLASTLMAAEPGVSVVVIEPEGGGFAQQKDRFPGVVVETYATAERSESLAGSAARVVKRKLGIAERAMREAIERGGVDVLFGEVNQVARCPVPRIGWIPDFQHRAMPELFSSQEVAARDRVFEDVARDAAVVMLSSEDARSDFERFAPAYKDKARVVPFVSLIAGDVYAADPGSVVRRYHINEPFVIVPNQWWRHKDHETAIRAAALVRETRPDVSWVFTGAVSDYRDPEHVSTLLQLIAELGLNERIHILGLLPRIEQLQLMRAAECVVQPSLFEGWSTVVEDAKTLGQRLVVSDLAVHREQKPPAAVFFPPRSSEGLARALEEMLSVGPVRIDEATALQDSGERARVFGASFVDVCRDAAGKR